VVALAVPGAAGATTVSGSLTGAKLPKKGKGVAAVRAIKVETGAIEGAKRTRAGSFSLSLPPARYLLIASSTPFRGRSASADGPPVRVNVTRKAKKKLKVRVKKKQRKKRRHKAHRSARPGFVDVDYPAIWVKRFDTSQVSAEWRVMGKGMADMLITDLVALEPPGCPTGPAVVERERLDEVIAEIQLSNSPAADPSTAIPEGHLIEHNMIITGRLRTDGDTIFGDAQVQDLRSGRTFTTTASAAKDDVFEMERKLAANLGQIICFPPPPVTDVPPPATCGITRQACLPTPAGPPKAYAGAVSGSEIDPITGFKLEWSGSVTMTYTDRHDHGAGGDEPPGDYWWFTPTGGSLHVTLSKPPTTDDCTWQGDTTIPITGNGEQSSVRADSGEPEYYLLGGFGPSDKVTYTITGPDTCSGTQDFGLYGIAYLATQRSMKSASTSLAGDAATPSDPIATQVTWHWSLGPQF